VEQVGKSNSKTHRSVDFSEFYGTLRRIGQSRARTLAVIASRIDEVILFILRFDILSRTFCNLSICRNIHVTFRCGSVVRIPFEISAISLGDISFSIVRKR